MHWMVCTVFYLASRLNGWKHKCTFCWMKDHWTWLISDIDAWDFFWYGTHYLFLGVTYIFKLLCKTSFLTLWVCECVFKVPCWWYIVAIWREPWKNSKCHLYNIFLLLLSAFFIDWLIIFEFGFTKFIHCWLINTENYDNGWPLKLIFGMKCQLHMHTGRQLKVILGSHCIVYIFVRILI